MVVASSKHKHVRTKLTTVQKATCHEKFAKLTNAIATARDTFQEEAQAIAQDHGHKRLNDYNEDCGVGERMKLPAFIKAHQADFSSEYYRLTIGQKEDLRKSVMNLHQSHVKIVRANPKALQKDINATFNIMQNKYHEPKLFYTSKVASFIKGVLGMEPKCFALILESWVVGDFNSAGTVSKWLTLTQLVNIITTTLNPVPDKKVVMNYDNYKWKIMETYSITLNIFPLGTVVNPGKKNIECQACGEKVYKPRKCRTKATSAKSQGVKSKEVIDDEDDEDAQHTDIDNENGEA
ncbi:hypothetical protein F4604DRAFT_1677291 [Suillus subluteus]|nr:hypothetical protein F4604DRAFT_1677291 [Suillus subluteus]